MKRSLAYVLAGVAAVIGAGMGYQALAEARDRRKYPPPGRRVDVGGHRRGPLVGRITDGFRWQLYRLRPILSRLGWHRLRHQPNGVIEELAPELQPMARAIGLRSGAYDWLLGEGPAIEPSEALMRSAPPLPPVPLGVLSAHYRVTPPRGVTAEQMDRVWMALQAELAQLLPDGRQVIAEKSGHFIMLDEPELLVEAIRDIVRRARGEV